MSRFLTATSILLGSLLPLCAGTLAQFRTVYGNIDVELYDQQKPVTVQNFIRYVESGRFKDTYAHRLVPGFVIQGGGYIITNRGSANWGSAPLETYPPIQNEFGVGPQLSNVYGTIAMAKQGGNTNSASSQWFFNLANNTYLDANDTNNLFVVFGRVVRGTNTLNLFNTFLYWTFPWGTPPAGTTNVVLHQYYAPPYDDLPLLRPLVEETNLIFVDITLLSVEVSPTNGSSRSISWNSVAGRTNAVEFTTTFPPAWQTLLLTNGTGTRCTVVDEAAEPKRFYRVRVDY